MPVRPYDWIAHHGRRTPEKAAVIDLAGERHFSDAPFDARISRIAAHLRNRLEVKRDDRVAVPPQHDRYAGVPFACGRVGAVLLPLNNRLTVPELRYIVCDAAPVLMIHDRDPAEIALTCASNSDCLGPSTWPKPHEETLMN